MHVESGVIDGALVVKNPIRIDGLVTGDISVAAGGILDLQGMCAKNLQVLSGGSAKVTGMVTGNVINDGGSLEVFGTIHGSLQTLAGKTVVSPTAVIVLGVTQSPGDNSQAVGFIGGAALGAAIGGPVGAVVGGIIGAILGKESKGLG